MQQEMVPISIKDRRIGIEIAIQSCQPVSIDATLSPYVMLGAEFTAPC